MDQVPCSGQPLEELDREAFERVWRRVMPEDRPDCPFTLLSDTPPAPLPAVPTVSTPQPRREPAPTPPVCLGEASATDLPQLEELLRQTVDAYRLYRALARRANGSRTPAAIAADKKRQSKRLATAYFLISGQGFTAAPTPTPRPSPLPTAIREHFQAEQHLAADLLAASDVTNDVCLACLYRSLAEENQNHAQQLRGWMEQM